MERTARLFRIALDSLPPAPNATILLPDDADDEEQRAEVLLAEVHGRAVNERGLSSGVAAVDEVGRAAVPRGLVHRVSQNPLPGAAEDQELRGTVEERPGGFAGLRAHYGARRCEIHEQQPQPEAGADFLEDHHGVCTATALARTSASSSGYTVPATSSGYASRGYDQYTDLYLYGRPVSHLCETIWMGLPLLLHDEKLLGVREYIATCRKNRRFNFDLTAEISSVLDIHPGPVYSFRIDSCAWTGGSDKLAQWLEIVSAKGVEELIVMNKMLPTSTVFQVNKLQGHQLTYLSISFMAIPGLSLGAFSYCSLDTLQLTGCTYCGKALDSVISDCTGLRCLILGCSQEDVSITSQSLMSIQIWNSTASLFTIDYAPKLLNLATGIRPKEGRHSVELSLNNVEALTEMSCLMLHFHDLTIRSASLIQGMVALPQVRRLRLGIQMGSTHQRAGLVKVLKRMPRLTHLILLIVEDSAVDEEVDEAALASALGPALVPGSTSAVGSLSCVQTCLHSLTVEGFRGGTAEVAVIASILRQASNLAKVVLEPCLSTAAADEAAKRLAECPRASIGCSIIVRHSD